MINLKKNIKWNMIGSLVYAFSSIAFTIIVSRRLSDKEAVEFLNAFNISNIAMVFAYYEMRTFQVTDTINKYSFGDYLCARIITCAMMLLGTGAYIVIKGESATEVIIVMLFAVFRLADGFGDLIEGVFQRGERLDLSGKSVTFRTLLALGVFTIIIYTNGNLILTIIGSIVSSFIGFYIWNIRVFINDYKNQDMSISIKRLKELFIECTPMFISTFISSYIINSTKLLIKEIEPNSISKAYNIIFMPVAVINLVASFIFRPLLTRLSLLINEKKTKEFKKIIIKLYLLIICFIVVSLIGTYFIGIPVLSIVFKTNLEGYKTALLILVIGGGLYAFSTFMYYILAILRKQFYSFLCYSVVFIIIILMNRNLIEKYSYIGGAISYTFAHLVLMIMFSFVITISLRRKN